MAKKKKETQLKLWRIIVHWTAGSHKACSTDINAYHYIIEADGNVLSGKFAPENNIACKRGNYAKHTGGGNTGSIGVSLCGMCGYQSRTSVGKYPLTKVQCETAFNLLAKLCRDYNINPQNIMTHYEFGVAHPVSTSHGKIDITYLPPYPTIQTSEVGGFIRNQVRTRLGMKPVDVRIAPGVVSSSGNSGGTSGGTSSGSSEKTPSASMFAGGGWFPKNPWGNMTPTPVGEIAEMGVATGGAAAVAAAEVDTGEINKSSLSFLKTTNDWLEKVPEVTTNALNNIVGSGERITQSKVDEVCEWLSYKVNVAVERKRQALIRTLHEQYENNQKGPVMKAAKAISSFVSDPLGSLGSFASAIFGPIQPVFDWIKVLIKEIPRLAANLANIVSSLPPPPPNPQINFDKFQIRVNSIGLKEITKGTAGMKVPEQMFPEPPDPFHHDTFAGLFGDESADLVSGAFKYQLKPEDYESISAIIRKETGGDLLDDIDISLDSF